MMSLVAIYSRQRRPRSSSLELRPRALPDPTPAQPPRGPAPFTFERASANSDEQVRTAALAWTSEFSQALRQTVGRQLGAYVNVPDDGLPNWETAYWGPNVERLRQIKAKHDPDNIFRYEQSIPPATP